MNKRMKKKRILFEHINTINTILERVLVVIEDQAKEIAELRELVERNAQATNSEITTITLDTTKLNERISYLESENNSTRVELDARKFKKPFWKR